MTRLETELLRLCASPRPDNERLERARTLATARCDWAFLIASARRHRVLPLVAVNILSNGFPDVPEDVRHELRHALEATAWRNCQLAHELVKLLETFSTRGITAVPVKGPVLASSAYGDLALREFFDLDVLIGEADVERAAALLGELGFAMRSAVPVVPWRALLNSGYELMFDRPSDQMSVELHWRCAPAYFACDLGLADVAPRISSAELAGQRVASLSNEDTLIALSIHGSKHGWRSLGYIADVAAVLSAGPIQWDPLFREAARMGSVRMVLGALGLANMVLDAPSPAGVHDRLAAEPRLTSLLKKVVARLFDELEISGSLFSDSVFHLRLRERISDRLRYAARLTLMPTAEDWAFCRARRAWSPFPYLCRPLRLARKYLGSRRASRGSDQPGMKTAVRLVQ